MRVDVSVARVRAVLFGCSVTSIQGTCTHTMYTLQYVIYDACNETFYTVICDLLLHYKCNWANDY